MVLANPKAICAVSECLAAASLTHRKLLVIIFCLCPSTCHRHSIYERFRKQRNSSGSSYWINYSTVSTGNEATKPHQNIAEIFCSWSLIVMEIFFMGRTKLTQKELIGQASVDFIEALKVCFCGLGTEMSRVTKTSLLERQLKTYRLWIKVNGCIFRHWLLLTHSGTEPHPIATRLRRLSYSIKQSKKRVSELNNIMHLNGSISHRVADMCFFSARSFGSTVNWTSTHTTLPNVWWLVRTGHVWGCCCTCWKTCFQATQDQNVYFPAFSASSSFLAKVSCKRLGGKLERLSFLCCGFVLFHSYYSSKMVAFWCHLSQQLHGYCQTTVTTINLWWWKSFSCLSFWTLKAAFHNETGEE